MCLVLLLLVVLLLSSLLPLLPLLLLLGCCRCHLFRCCFCPAAAAAAAEPVFFTICAVVPRTLRQSITQLLHLPSGLGTLLQCINFGWISPSFRFAIPPTSLLSSAVLLWRWRRYRRTWQDEKPIADSDKAVPRALYGK